MQRQIYISVGEEQGGRKCSCELMIILCVHDSAASKVDAATQTDATLLQTDASVKTEIISTEPEHHQ